MSMSKGAELLAAAIDKAGITPSAMALQLGFYHTRFSRWLKGEGMPHIKAAFQMEDKLGVPARAWTEPAKSKKAA